MRGTRWIEAGLCAGLLLSGGAAFPEESASPAQEQPAKGDREFLEQALGVNELELRLGRLAAERASTPEAKAAAEKMVKNHTEIGRRLSELAKQAGGSGSAELTPEQRETFARVESQSGASFDTTFKETVDAGHVKELAMYQAEVSRASSPGLRALSEERVAALQKAVAGAKQPAKAAQGEMGK